MFDKLVKIGVLVITGVSFVIKEVVPFGRAIEKWWYSIKKKVK